MCCCWTALYCKVPHLTVRSWCYKIHTTVHHPHSVLQVTSEEFCTSSQCHGPVGCTGQYCSWRPALVASMQRSPTPSWPSMLRRKSWNHKGLSWRQPSNNMQVWYKLTGTTWISPDLRPRNQVETTEKWDNVQSTLTPTLPVTGHRPNVHFEAPVPPSFRSWCFLLNYFCACTGSVCCQKQQVMWTQPGLHTGGRHHHCLRPGSSIQQSQHQNHHLLGVIRKPWLITP